MTNSGWRVRRASVEDLDAVVRLRLALFMDLEQEGTRQGGEALVEATRRYLREALPAGTFAAWLGETETGEAVACAGLASFERPPAPGAIDAREGYVLNMYTAPEWRRKGLARAMMEAVLAHARQSKLNKLWLHASDDGRPLYESLGFRPNLTALEWEP